jgi:NADH-quinone oxidoreductase subunit A
MLEGYLPILVLFIMALGVTIVFTALAFVSNAKNASPEKLSPYEGGVPLVEKTPRRFPVKFLEVAMIFLIFDIETVAFFPWAVVLNQLGLFGLIEAGLFLLVLGVGYIYIWKKGAFDWEKV